MNRHEHDNNITRQGKHLLCVAINAHKELKEKAEEREREIPKRFPQKESIFARLIFFLMWAQ